HRATAPRAGLAVRLLAPRQSRWAAAPRSAWSRGGHCAALFLRLDGPRGSTASGSRGRRHVRVHREPNGSALAVEGHAVDRPEHPFRPAFEDDLLLPRADVALLDEAGDANRRPELREERHVMVADGIAPVELLLVGTEPDGVGCEQVPQLCVCAAID